MVGFLLIEDLLIVEILLRILDIDWHTCVITVKCIMPRTTIQPAQFTELQQDYPLQSDMHAAERNLQWLCLFTNLRSAIFRSGTAAYFRCVIKHTAMDAIHTDPQRYIETVSAMGSAVRSTRTSMWLADLQSSPQRAIKSAPVQVADAEREVSLESPSMHRVPQMWWYESCILFHSSNRHNYKNSLNPQEN